MLEATRSDKHKWNPPVPAYALGRDHGKVPELLAKFEKLSAVGFDEDKRMIEAIQQAFLRDPRDPADWEVSVRSDTAGVQARRILQRWMQREMYGGAA